MRIDALKLQSFRNYNALDVAFAPDCNVIVGENAQGKTNLLEAIVYLSSARSPRARAEKELISFGKSECSIRADAFARSREFLLEISLAAGRRRKILINKVPAKKGGELSDVLGAVYFCPEDLLLIRDGAAARRKFMDDALCQLRARYAQALSDYHRAYEHKTRILRDSEEYPSLLDTLPEFDLRMAQSGAVLIYYRARFCERLGEYARIAHRECSGGREELGVTYQTVSTISDPLAPIETIYEQLRAHQSSHALGRASLAHVPFGAAQGRHRRDDRRRECAAVFLAGTDAYGGARLQARRAGDLPRDHVAYAAAAARRCALRA